MKIAMWSGPRNLSTAMMYAFGNRADCAVVDEPFYAAYLDLTGMEHPMRAEILASQSREAAVVAATLIGPNPEGKPHFYQKHMCQHMLPGLPRDWMRKVRNVFLIRHPARVVASYAAKREDPTLDDIGFWQQAELFDAVQAAGGDPVVIDSHDIRADPDGMLRVLCAAVDLPFDPAMLHWPAGGHAADGVWAAHWYGAVHRSTGFAGAEGALPKVTGAYAEVVAQAMPYFERLREHKITVTD